MLGEQLVSLFHVCGQPEAADATQGVTGKALHPVEGSLGQSPQPCRTLGAEPLPCSVVGHRPAPEGEATVPPARAGGDRARLVRANAQPTFREGERAGQTRDAAADDSHVDCSIQPGTAKRLGGLVNPVRLSHATIVVTLT